MFCLFLIFSLSSERELEQYALERVESRETMALLEDHVSRNLSQLPGFGVELAEMEFSSVKKNKRLFLIMFQVCLY